MAIPPRWLRGGQRPRRADGISKVPAEYRGCQTTANSTNLADTSPCNRLAQNIEPTPTPIANNDSSSVITEPIAVHVVSARDHRKRPSVINVAPTVQNQESPKAHCHMQTLIVREAEQIDRLHEKIPSYPQRRVGCRNPRHVNCPQYSPEERGRCPGHRRSPEPPWSRINPPPVTVPATMHRNVVASIRPFPAINSFSARSSGNTPYSHWAERAPPEIPRPTRTASKPGTHSNTKRQP